MKLSFSTLGSPDWTIEEVARRAKEMGYDGIELRTADDGNHLSPGASPAEVEAIARTFDAQKVAVVSVLGYARFATLDKGEIEKNQALVRKSIEIARTLKAPFIRAYAGQLPKGADREAIIKSIIEGLKPVSDEAAKAKVKVAIETHDDWCAGENIMRVVSGVNSPGLGVLYDIFNSFIESKEGWEKTYSQIKKHISYCHVKDGYRKPGGGHEYVYLGAGDLPLKEIFARFKADKFDGYMSCEWEKKWIPELDPPEKVFPHYAHKARALWESA